MKKTIESPLLNASEVSRLVRIKEPGLLRRIKNGTFPPPVTSPHEMRMWNRSEIDAYLIGEWRRREKEMPQTPGQRKAEEALIDAELAKWGL